ncbi:D(4) dopamine receptor-like [Notolabrus celidotus]|uniref:D(4) dopamine receptor-like n=1 Tax=Notolabrus celidotus TaxID=1203425 RepID=UPI00149063E6|nr:D(4) dopamine receptor-like [Notolabrus celidotus]
MDPDLRTRPVHVLLGSFICLVGVCSLCSAERLCTVPPGPVSVPENNTADIQVVKISSISDVTLSVSVNPEDLFYLRGNALMVKKGLDYESLSSAALVVWVQCSREGSSSVNESVEVLVENVNDNPPNFAQSHFLLEVNELTAVNSSVGLIEATDVDSEPLYYRLESATWISVRSSSRCLCSCPQSLTCCLLSCRFIAVSIPLKYNRKHVDHRQLVLLSATWLLALAVASPVIFGINNVPHRDPSECKLEDNTYVVYSSVCSFFIPCPIMLLLYVGVFRGLQHWEEARKHKLRSSIEACRKLQHAAIAAAALPPLTGTIPGPLPLPLPRIIERDLAQCRLDDTDDDMLQEIPYPRQYRENSVPTLTLSDQLTRRKRAKINNRERKAMKVLPVVVGCFLFCWTPFFVVHTTRAVCLSCTIPHGLMSAVTWLGYVNSALNPVIYTVFNAEFKKFFKKCFRSVC